MTLSGGAWRRRGPPNPADARCYDSLVRDDGIRMPAGGLKHWGALTDTASVRALRKISGAPPGGIGPR